MESLAIALKEAIHLVDSAVFPSNPLPITVAPKELGGDPRPNPAQFAFCRNLADPSKRSDFYGIFEKGLAEYFQAIKDSNAYAIEVAKKHNIAARVRPDDLGLVEILPYDEARSLISRAIHEVRHRVQYHLGAILFSEYYVGQIERCRLWARIQAKHYASEPNGAREFDAKFFESYGEYELYRGRLKIEAHDLKNLLLMTPEQFLERERLG